MVRDLQRNHPTAARDVMRTTRVRSKVERSRACAPLTKTQVWDSGFFAHALFVPKTPNVMGFSGSVNGTTKNPGFLDFGFCQCKWAYCITLKYEGVSLALIMILSLLLLLISRGIKSAFILSYDTMSYKTTLRTTAYQYIIYIIVSCKTFCATTIYIL